MGSCSLSACRFRDKGCDERGRGVTDQVQLSEIPSRPSRFATNAVLAVMFACVCVAWRSQLPLLPQPSADNLGHFTLSSAQLHKTACAVSFGTCIMAIYATQSPRYASECFGSKMLPLFQTRASRVIRSGETCRQITHRCHVGRGVLQTHHVSCLRMFVVDFNQGGLEGEAFVGI